MSGGYEVVPMAAGGDICALHDADGRQIAMGPREICQTLLYLVTNSPLMERPRVLDALHLGRRVGPQAAPARGRADSTAGGAGDRRTPNPGSSASESAAPDLLAPREAPGAHRADTGPEDVEEDVLELLALDCVTTSPRAAGDAPDPDRPQAPRAPEPHAYAWRPEGGRPGAEGAGGGGRRSTSSRPRRR